MVEFKNNIIILLNIIYIIAIIVIYKILSIIFYVHLIINMEYIFKIYYIDLYNSTINPDKVLFMCLCIMLTGFIAISTFFRL